MRLCFLLFSFLSVFAKANIEQTNINYLFKVIDAAHHTAEVTITFPKISTKTLEVKLPVWRSGRYEILDLSHAISQFSVSHSNGQDIQWNKVDKNTWKLWLNQPGDIVVKYHVYANSLKERVIHIDPTHAFLDASGVFMFSPSLRDQALSVELSVPNDWQSRSGMEKMAEHHFLADNYDQLVDSPIETGIHEFLTFQVEDKTYEIVIWGEGNYDINDLKEKVSLLHFESKKIWHDFPFNRYVYMYHLGDDLRGATEHVNSTIIQQKRFNFNPRKSYLKVLATTAHEFVHTWNVKAYRPAGIAPYDYPKENYSELFWLAEGITSYYDDLLLMRAGIYKAEEYFEQLAEKIQSHLNNPGRNVKSLAASSFDTWLKQEAQLNHNNSVSIYTEGALVSWRLDQEIRQMSNNQYGMDELQKRLFNAHNNIDIGYQKADVFNHLKDITGHDFKDFWQQYIEGTTAIDFDELLSFYGLEKYIEDKDESSHKAWIGVNFDLDGQAVKIKTVDRDSPAWHAGLTANDQIIAINGIKLNDQDALSRIEMLSIEQSYQVHFFSAGILKKTTLKPQANPNPAFKIRPVKKPTRKQKNHFKSWTGKQLITVK